VRTVCRKQAQPWQPFAAFPICGNRSPSVPDRFAACAVAICETVTGADSLAAQPFAACAG
jgi:hypothetical protein